MDYIKRQKKEIKLAIQLRQKKSCPMTGGRAALVEDFAHAREIQNVEPLCEHH